MIHFVVGELLESFRNGRLRAAIAVSTVSIAMLIFSGFLFASENINAAIARYLTSSRIEVLLSSGLDPLDVSEKIINVPGVARTDFYSQEEALKYFRMANGDDLTDGITNALGEIPFPPFVEVFLEESVTNPAIVAIEIESIPGVDEVIYGEESVKQLSTLARKVSMVSYATAILMTFFVFLIVMNNVRASLHVREYEINVMRLIGATEKYIVLPFLLEGLIIGLFGAVFGLVSVYAGFRYMIPEIGFVSIRFLSPEVLAAVLLFGTGVGGLGGLFASRETR
ncbi:MAG: ABC transporter permease [Candidatus Lindowbacteria bacterium]|nr:ABC transporter permease [Candidatus Lindowbacteria bacterium]